MILRPLHDKVIVKQRDVEEVSLGGILIAGKTEKPLKGDVVAVGPGRYLGDVFIKTTLKIGDVVIFGNNTGEELDEDTLNPISLIVMREREILAVIDE